MSKATFEKISKTYDDNCVLKNVSCEIEEGSFSVVFGQSGCGKSLLLRLLTGFEKPTSGSISIEGKDVVHISPGERGIGYIPQSFALYPHYKVYDNIAYPLKLGGEKQDHVKDEVNRVAEMLNITKLLNKYPDKLSGGEKQRVALARGIIKKSNFFVFDDPLCGLDFKLRERIMDDLRIMQKKLNATFLYTTSDPLEAMMLADKIFILDGGEIIESGKVEDIYYKPMQRRSMELLGFPKANVFSGRLEKSSSGTVCKSDIFEIPVAFEAGKEDTDLEIKIGIRPKDIKLEAVEDEMVKIEAEIVLREDLGGELELHLEIGEHSFISIIRQDDIYLVKKDRIDIYIPYKSIVIFSLDDDTRIGHGGTNA